MLVSLAKIGGLKSIFFRGPKRFIYLFILGGGGGGGQIAKMGGQIAHSINIYRQNTYLTRREISFSMKRPPNQVTQQINY